MCKCRNVLTLRSFKTSPKMKRRLPAVREDPKTHTICTSDLAIYAMVISTAVLSYVNSLNGDFVHDDIPAVVSNGDVVGGSSLKQLLLDDFWGTPMADPNSHKSYRPLTTLSFRAKIIYVRVGASDLNSEDVTEYPTKLYIIHPDYDEDALNFDVALLFIPDGIEIDGVRTRAVQLASEGTPLVTGSKVVVSGYGIQEAVTVPIVSQDECRESYEYLTDQMFCAGFPQGGKDACQGDSGGPAVSTVNGNQLGIVSFGNGCGRPGYPGVFANIANYIVRNFIKKHSRV